MPRPADVILAERLAQAMLADARQIAALEAEVERLRAEVAKAEKSTTRTDTAAGE